MGLYLSLFNKFLQFHQKDKLGVLSKVFLSKVLSPYRNSHYRFPLSSILTSRQSAGIRVICACLYPERAECLEKEMTELITVRGRRRIKSPAKIVLL